MTIVTKISEMEEAITFVVREMTITILSEGLEVLDKDIVTPYLSEGWEINRIEERQLIFSFGFAV